MMWSRRRASWMGLAGALTLASLGGRVAYAQERPANAAQTVEPPRLVEFVEAPYPEEARGRGQEGDVGLKLTIDAEGRVTEAIVVESKGFGLDEAAREAALRFRFAPARRGEKAVASRILYAYEFRLPKQPPPAEPATQPPIAEPIGAPPAQPKLARNARPIDVHVQGVNEAERVRRSAEAVSVVEIEEQRRQSADLGEVLARTDGVGVRRSGGLGSNARFSLNGLTDDQIRFFLDGVPLAFSGYAFGVANVPVNIVERVELYQGVVPVRFGADALGGAVNLVTDRSTRGTHASASYQVGSFKTYRATLGLSHADERTGIFARASGFLDYAANDYPIEVDVFDDRGRLSPATVHRFHDGYRAIGGSLEVGVAQRTWAERLALRAFYAENDRQVQHNILMTVPYGDVTYGRNTSGAHISYAQPFSKRARLDAVLGYAYARTDFRDLGTCRYDWYGRCAAELPQPGEIETKTDQVIHQHTAFARLNLTFRPAASQFIRIGVSPTATIRSGDDRAIPLGEYDPLVARRSLTSGVAGVEYEVRPFGARLANIAFVKGYLQAARAEEQLPNGYLRDLARQSQRIGFGDSLRYNFTKGLYGKISYEYATRLTSPEELFGNGALILENLHLSPEASHNLNLGLALSQAETPVGAIQLSVQGFGRFAEDLIVLLGTGSYFHYENVLSARSVGVEGSAGWTSPGGFLSLRGNATYLDFRNTSGEGTFADFYGDRVPNRPYLFASGSARVEWPSFGRPNDTLSLTWMTRYVHSFFRSWESVGAAESKLVIPAQLAHSIALSYLVKHGKWSLSGTVEVQNLTNEKIYDYFGAQLPGRAAYTKVVVEL